MNQIELKKIGEIGALDSSLIFFFGMITDPPKNCQTDWSLKIFKEMGALDSERLEYP